MEIEFCMPPFFKHFKRIENERTLIVLLESFSNVFPKWLENFICFFLYTKVPIQGIKDLCKIVDL